MHKINPGDKAYTTTGELVSLVWVLNGKAGDKNNNVYPLDSLTVVERSLYQTRIMKPIDRMTDEELLASLSVLRDDRTEVMMNSGMKTKKVTKPKVSKSGKTTSPRSTKRATKKPANWSVLESILSPEEIQNLKNRILAGEDINPKDYGI